MVLSMGTEETGKRGDLGSRMRACLEFELADIHKMIPEVGREFSRKRRKLAVGREVGL